MPNGASAWERRVDDSIAALASVLAAEPAPGDLRETAERVVRALEPCFEPAALALFSTSERETGSLQLIAHRGVPPELADRLRSVSMAEGGVTGEAVRRREAVVVERSAAGAETSAGAMSRMHPAARLDLALPFVAHGRVLGAMEMVLDGDEPVTPSSLARLATLGALLGVAFAEARSRRVAVLTASRLERAQQAQRTVVEALSVLPEQQLHAAVRRGFYVWPQYLETTVPEFIATVIQQVAHAARSLVRAEMAAIGIGDLPDRPFSPWAFSGVPEAMVTAVGRTPRPVGTLGLVACQGRSVRVPDVREHPSYRGLPPGHPPVKSLLGVPIRYGRQTLGNLYLANKIGAEEFTMEDQSAVEALADQAAIALQQGFLQASIEAQRAQTQSLLDSAPHGILFVDGQTRRVMANPSAMRLLGENVSPDAGIEQYIDRLRYPDGRPVPPEATPAYRALQGEEHPTEQFVIARRDGTQIPILESAAPVRGFGRKLLGAVVNFEDVSAVRDVERMRNVERVREEFNATVAHDLRNPIQTVLAQIYLLLRQAEADEVKVPVQALRRIERSATTLGRMAGVLLDVSRIELKRIQLRREPACLPDVVAEIVDRMRPALAEDGHAIELTIDGRLPTVGLDSLSFEQIVTNLVDNAAKFSPKGAPIRVSLRSSDGGALLSVRDQGPGIRREDQARLFDRFYRTGSVRQRRTGLGLGLFIVKGYTEAHGGRVTVESEPGRGSSFDVWLPAFDAASEQAGAPASGQVSAPR